MSPALVAALIFFITLAAILWDKLDRTIVALAGASVMVGVGTLLGFYDEHAAIASIDFETLGLLFGMMTLVSLLRPTGAFEFLATTAAKLSRGRPIILLVLLGGITSILSMLLDNVTTIVLIAPVTVLITEILGISPIPFLITEAILSNTAGVGTLVGDPPNILIGSAAGFSFNDFLTHSLPMVAIAWLGVMGLLVWMFRKQLVQPIHTAQVLKGLRPEETLKDPASVRKLIWVLALTVLLFFLQTLLGLSASFIALSMATLALLLLRPTVEHVFERLEWSVLIFFGGLFVIAGGLENSGALDSLEALILRTSRGNPIVTALFVFWLSAVASSLVDNIPITITIIPVIQHLAEQGIQVNPLWWALAFGAGFGGNGTIIGSTANVVVVQLTKRMDKPISSFTWMRYGVPAMLLSGIVASLFLYLAYPWFLD